MRGAVLAVLMGLALGGCDDPRGEAIDNVETDAASVSKASGAVNEVIRNSTDCAAAKPLIPEAYERIEETLLTDFGATTAAELPDEERKRLTELRKLMGREGEVPA